MSNETDMEWSSSHPKSIHFSRYLSFPRLKLRGVFTLQNTAKLMKFVGQEPVPCKLALDNKRLQEKNFKFLCSEISYKNDEVFNKN
jgi:hypothetical protein